MFTRQLISNLKFDEVKNPNSKIIITHTHRCFENVWAVENYSVAFQAGLLPHLEVFYVKNKLCLWLN